MSDSHSDLDCCPDIEKKVRVVGHDEYRLDAKQGRLGLRELRLTQVEFALHGDR